eukprot:2117833-Alexandrium_andersonii.AAC.1
MEAASPRAPIDEDLAGGSMEDKLRIFGLVSSDDQRDVGAQPSLTCPRQCHKEGLQRNRTRKLNTLKHSNMLSR